MNILINGISYSCTGYEPNENTVLFLGVENLELPVNGEIKLICEIEGEPFEFAIDDSNDYLRQTYENNTLSLTNKLVPLEETRISILNALNGMCSGAIYQGITIGAYHYSFTEKTQVNLETIARMINEGQTVFLYRADNEFEQRSYAASEMSTIITAKSEWITVNTNYYELLKKWINRETDEAIIKGIHYGSVLPKDLTQELATKLASVGIDVKKYATMFG